MQPPIILERRPTMNIDGIKKPEDLPFDVPNSLAKDINALIDAMHRDDPDLDCYQDEVHGSARSVEEEYDMWIREYYLNGGWRKDVKPIN